MFKRKDVLRSLFLFIIIVALMLTLSQILVVHRRTHITHVNKSRDSRRVQAMISTLMRIEKAIESMMKKTFLSTDDFEEHLKAVMYTERIRSVLMSSPGFFHSSTHKHILTVNSVFEYLRYQDRRLNFLNVSSDNIKPEHYQSYLSHVKNHTSTELGYFRKTTIGADENTLNFNRDKLDNDPNYIPKADETIITQDESKDEYINVHHNFARKGFVDKDRINYSLRRINDTRYNKSVTDENTETVKKCQINIEKLEGKLDVQWSIQASSENMSDIAAGGSWRPVTCVAQQRIVIIIPYRDREIHLQALLLNLIPVLKKQLLDFRIFVIEQYGQMTFNKGRLMNAGFKEAWKMGHFDCVIFHDVDLLPENDKNMYTCGETPRHMSIAVDKFGYRLPYFALVGGVFSIKREQFLKVNGYSNLYWGWGAEDDDMSFRLRALKLSIERPPANIGRYKMIKHENRETSPVKVRAYLLKTVRKRFHRDGLNTLEYHVIFINNTQLFTHIMVDVGRVPDEAADITRLLN